MKIIIDNAKTFGNEILYLEHRTWNDFNDKNKILGTIITVVLPQQDYEKINVKIPKPTSDFDSLEKNNTISLTNLTATPYVQNNFIKWSFKADDAQFQLIK